MSSAKLQDIRQTYKNQLYFYTLAINIKITIANIISQKMKYLGIELTKYVQFFVETGKITIKFIVRSKETRIAKTILERKNKISLPGFTIREVRNEPIQTKYAN